MMRTNSQRFRQMYASCVHVLIDLLALILVLALVGGLSVNRRSVVSAQSRAP